MKKVAVITGVSYGLGESIGKKLLEMGYFVYGISRSQPKIQSKAFIWIKADLLNESDLKAIPRQIKEEKIDLLINNAGLCFLKKTLEYNDNDFEKMFTLNFKVHVHLTTYLFKKLKNGLIINISSLSDRYPDPKWGLYGASKTALNLFFETMAEENKEVKIINILPSYIDTPMQHQVHDNTDFNWSICMKPEEISQAIEFILNNKLSIKSGSRIIVEKKYKKNEFYTPEKLWIYSTEDQKIRRIR